MLFLVFCKVLTIKWLWISNRIVKKIMQKALRFASDYGVFCVKRQGYLSLFTE